MDKSLTDVQQRAHLAAALIANGAPITTACRLMAVTVDDIQEYRNTKEA